MVDTMSCPARRAVSECQNFRDDKGTTTNVFVFHACAPRISNLLVLCSQVSNKTFLRWCKLIFMYVFKKNKLNCHK